MSSPTSGVRLTLAAIVLSLVTFTLPPLPAAAQDEQAIEEVIVTATRKETTLTDTPAAISALAAEELGLGAVEDVGDLQYRIPNLSVANQFGVNRAFIRGIGLTSIELGADGAVAFHVDGAIIARPAAQLASYFDLERVEVLRGPQGTLYGRGATAGAINVVTRKPTEVFSGNGSITAGNYGLVAAEGGISGPMVEDKLFFRLAAKTVDRDGYGENLFTGTEINTRDHQAFRGTLEWRPADELEITVSGDYYEEDDTNYAYQFFGPTTIDPLFGQLLGGQTIFDAVANPDPWDIYSDVDPKNDREGKGAVANIRWERGKWSLRSITSYRDFYRQNVADLDSTSFDAFGRITYTEDSETLSQELLVTYAEDNWDLLFGAMYFEEDLFGSTFVPLNNIELIVPGALPGGTFDQKGTVDIEALGLFVQGTYNFTDRLSATLGVRYSEEDRDHVGSFTFSALGILGVPTDKSDSWDAVTPKLVVDYQLTPTTMIYGNIERGFKSGVINIGAINPAVDPEFVWNYEVGVKTQLMDNRVQLAASAFYYDYTDLQVGRVDETSTPITENAAEARNTGLEIEGNAVLTDALSVDFYATYLNAEFDEFDTFEPNRPGEGEKDLSGNTLPNAPELTWFIGANYTVPLAGGDLRFRGEISWVDDIYFTEFNNEDAFQESYAMTNASVRYTPASGAWNIEVWGKNLGDEDIKANNIVAAPLFAFPQVGALYPPRTYGATISVNF